MAVDQHQFRRFKTLLRIRSKKDRKKLKSLLVSGGKPLQAALRECAFNLLRGNVPLKPSQLSKLKPFRAAVRQLARKTTPLKARLRIEQRGGFLPALLGPLMTVLPGIIGSILS